MTEPSLLSKGQHVFVESKTISRSRALTALRESVSWSVTSGKEWGRVLFSPDSWTLVAAAGAHSPGTWRKVMSAADGSRGQRGVQSEADAPLGQAFSSRRQWTLHHFFQHFLT